MSIANANTIFVNELKEICMAKFNIAIDHNLTRQIAVSKLQTFSESLRSQIRAEVTEVEERWDDDGNLSFSFKAMGFAVSGQVVTCESQVTVAGTLPFAALPFRAQSNPKSPKNSVKQSSKAARPIRRGLSETRKIRFWGETTLAVSRTAQLFYRHALGQVSRFVDVTAASYGDVIGKQLQGNRG